MKNLAICILTRGRSEKQATLRNLPYEIRNKIFLVVDEDEEKEHKIYKDEVREIMAMPKKFSTHKWGGNFSDKKEWTARKIHKKGLKYIFFLDDDIYFCIRKNGKLEKAGQRDIKKLFSILYLYMVEDSYAHIGLSPREGNNRVEENHVNNSRTYRFCGFNLDVIKKHNLEFNRTILMADFDITLQLLELGYQNIVLYKYANGSGGSNAAGGCSIYRSPETMKQAANHLHSLHTQFVKVQEKTTSQPWAGFDTKTRTDVTVYWKKAYNYGESQKSGIKNFLRR